MNTEPVIDASAIVASIAQEECSSWADKEINSYNYFHILDLTYYEVANSIKNKVREKRLTNIQAKLTYVEARRFMDLCGVHAFSEIIDNIMEGVVKQDVTSYDMAYLCLSKMLDAKLITTDLKLVGRLKGTSYYKMLEYPVQE